MSSILCMFCFDIYIYSLSNDLTFYSQYIHTSFNHFYGPPRGGLDKKDDNNIRSDEPKVVPHQSTVIDHDNDTTKDKKSGGSSDAQCSKHDKCAALGLTGLCCPTQKDTMLECC